MVRSTLREIPTNRTGAGVSPLSNFDKGQSSMESIKHRYHVLFWRANLRKSLL